MRFLFLDYSFCNCWALVFSLNAKIVCIDIGKTFWLLKIFVLLCSCCGLTSPLSIGLSFLNSFDIDFMFVRFNNLLLYSWHKFLNTFGHLRVRLIKVLWRHCFSHIEDLVGLFLFTWVLWFVIIAHFGVITSMIEVGDKSVLIFSWSCAVSWHLFFNKLVNYI